MKRLLFAALLLLTFNASAQVKISALPETGTVGTSDELVLNQSGATKRVKVQYLPFVTTARFIDSLAALRAAITGSGTGDGSVTSVGVTSTTATVTGSPITSNGSITIEIPNTYTTNAGSQTLTNKTLTSPVINSPTGITKANVGLANADNTSDANKPVSTATQTALDGKAALSHTHVITNVTGLIDSLANIRAAISSGGAGEPADQVDTLLGMDHIDLWRGGHHYYATMSQLSSYVVGYVPAGSPEQQVTALFSSTSGVTLTEANALQKFTDSATVHGYYDKIIAYYPFVGNSLANKVYNMVNPYNTDGAFRLTLTSCSDDAQGIALTGGTSYADTHLDPSLITGAPYVGVGYYLSTAIQNMFLGCNGTQAFQIFQTDNSTTTAYPNIFGQSAGISYTGGNVASIKFYQRHSSNQVQYWSGGTLKGTDASFSAGSATSTSILLNKNNATINATSSVVKDAIITEELTDTEAGYLQADRQMLMTDLGK